MDEDRSRLLGHPFVARAARWGVVAWAGIGVLVLGYIIFRYALYPVRIIFPPLVVALVLVYVLNPIVSRLQDRGMPRLLAALVTYFVFLTLIVVGFMYLIPVVADQVQEFA
ncbi:MAG TPA: AI-2E family transporter, partial [Acidimicrobiia bacterium]